MTVLERSFQYTSGKVISEYQCTTTSLALQHLELTDGLLLNAYPGVVLYIAMQACQTGNGQGDRYIFACRLVISDVDGTITRSDLLGHMLPRMGWDWSHLGIATLFSNISDNGYDMLFLSSRAIAQASATRDYLHTLKQDGSLLPQGPVIISPDGLFPSLYRELVSLSSLWHPAGAAAP